MDYYSLISKSKGTFQIPLCLEPKTFNSGEISRENLHGPQSRRFLKASLAVAGADAAAPRTAVLSEIKFFPELPFSPAVRKAQAIAVWSY